MKRSLCAVAIVLFASYFAFAQQTKSQGAASAKSARAPALQAKIEQAWKDWVKKNRKAVDKVLADDAVEIWADGTGAHDKKSTLEGMQSMNIQKYALSDFKFTPLGPNAQLAQYKAVVEVPSASSTQKYNLVVSEVWQKHGSDWKLVHYQETEIK
jgi:hypothetical protein